LEGERVLRERREKREWEKKAREQGTASGVNS